MYVNDLQLMSPLRSAIILTKNTLLWNLSDMDNDNDKRDIIEVDPSKIRITGAKDRSFFGSF